MALHAGTVGNRDRDLPTFPAMSMIQSIPRARARRHRSCRHAMCHLSRDSRVKQPAAGHRALDKAEHRKENSMTGSQHLFYSFIDRLEWLGFSHLFQCEVVTMEAMIGNWWQCDNFSWTVVVAG